MTLKIILVNKYYYCMMNNLVFYRIQRDFSLVVYNNKRTVDFLKYNDKFLNEIDKNKHICIIKYINEKGVDEINYIFSLYTNYLFESIQARMVTQIILNSKFLIDEK